jgi:D-hexose-6-phosphate mutarotase
VSQVTLSSGSLEAVINAKGAWLDSLEFDKSSILFPKQVIETQSGAKTRGGCHVCLPNFGPGGTSGLAQHGFARDAEWTLIERSTNHVLFSLQVLEGEYAGMKALLKYTLTATSARLQLTVTNLGSKAIEISPGFHPYFQINEKQIAINGINTSVDDYSEAIIMKDAPQEIRIDKFHLTIAATNIDQWVLWSDGLDNYFCIEPTQSGFSFQNDITEAVLLQPDKEWQSSFTVTVNS